MNGLALEEQFVGGKIEGAEVVYWLCGAAAEV